MGYNWDDSTTDIMPVDAFKTNFRVQYEMLEIYSSFMQGLENTISSDIVYRVSESIDLNHGYQVRCQKEK